MDSTRAFPDFLRDGMRANLEEAQRLERRSELTEAWLARLTEYALYGATLGQGRAALDTLKTHLAAHPRLEPRLRVTASEVEATLERGAARPRG